MNLCIYPETLDFQQFWCNLEEEKFVRLTPSRNDGGRSEKVAELGTPTLAFPRFKFNREGQPDRYV